MTMSLSLTTVSGIRLMDNPAPGPGPVHPDFPQGRQRAVLPAAVSPTWDVELQTVHSAPQPDTGRSGYGRSNFDIVIGCDEVGRGCLAGPVMVGACAFSVPSVLSKAAGSLFPAGLKDSKMLSEKKREQLVEPVQEWCDAYAVGSSTNREIDRQGIMAALGTAAARAIRHILETVGYPCREAAVILDGPHDYITPAIEAGGAAYPVLSGCGIEVFPVVKGDQKCVSVAGASVIAKVTRDRYMVGLAGRHPEWAAYAWQKNKGYGSAAHRRAIRLYGATPYHRVSWKLR